MVLGIVVLAIIMFSAWKLCAKENMALLMTERILPSMEGHRDGNNHGQNLGGRGAGGLGVDSIVVHLNGDGEEGPVEKWFFLEKSPIEVCALTCLEGELGSTPLFEHDGGKSVSPLWVARILLRHLFLK